MSSIKTRLLASQHIDLMIVVSIFNQEKIYLCHLCYSSGIVGDLNKGGPDIVGEDLKPLLGLSHVNFPLFD